MVLAPSPLSPGRGGSTLGQGRHLPPDTCCPQIQKLADRSDVISEVPKCSKIQIFREHAGRAYSAPQAPGGDRCPCQEPHLALGPSGLVSMGLRV